MKLQIIIPDAPKQLPTHTILDLCDYLSAKVLEPLFAREGAPWDHRFMNFFVLDNTCDPLESTGTIRMAVPLLFAGRVGYLEEAIRGALFQLGIRTGTIRYEKNTSGPAQEIMVIPVEENPTALIAPPAVNIAYARGCVVLHNLLGYRPVDGCYRFSSEEILQRASTVTEEQIAACVVSPVKVADEIRRVPSPSATRAVARCLEEIKGFARWAVSHNYRQLVAA
jgi:hypothetical protein